jgi:hypothetical protein
MTLRDDHRTNTEHQAARHLDAAGLCPDRHAATEPNGREA